MNLFIVYVLILTVLAVFYLLMRAAGVQSSKIMHSIMLIFLILPIGIVLSVKFVGDAKKNNLQHTLGIISQGFFNTLLLTYYIIYAIILT